MASALRGHGQAAMPPTYSVQRGDTLWEIAAEHHISLGELLAVNPQIHNPDQIDVGQVVKLPQPTAPSRIRQAARGVRAENGTSVAGKRKQTAEAAAPQLPKWYRIALDEKDHYVYGRENLYRAQTGLGGGDWCSVFANWVMQRAGYTGTRSALAATWTKWGIGAAGAKARRDRDPRRRLSQ